MGTYIIQTPITPMELTIPQFDDPAMNMYVRQMKEIITSSLEENAQRIEVGLKAGTAILSVANVSATGLELAGNCYPATDSTYTSGTSALYWSATYTDKLYLNGGVDIEKILVPVGSIIPFYDFDAALTFDTDYWAYCNGQTKTIAGSARVLPDLSGRYLCGFGVDGDGLMGSATWSVDPIGNAAHTNTIGSANLPTHTHDINHTHGNMTSGNQSQGHTHDIAHGHADSFAVSAVSGTFGSSTHTHGAGTLKFVVGYSAGLGVSDVYFYDTSGSAIKAFEYEVAIYASGLNVGGYPCTASQTFYTYTGSGSSDTPSATGSVSGGVLSGSVTSLGTTASGAVSQDHTHTTNITALGATASGNGGFANNAFDIRPRSIRCRYIMRIL